MSSDEGEPREEEEEGFFTVEKILEYKLGSIENIPEAGAVYDPTLGDRVYLVQYKVRWLGYEDPAEDTWEPKESFAAWLPSYSETIQTLLSNDANLKHPNVLEEEAIVLNNQSRERKKLKEEKKAQGKKKRRLSQSKTTPISQASTSTLPSKPPGRYTNNSMSSQFKLEVSKQNESPSADMNSPVVENGNGKGKGKGKGKELVKESKNEVEEEEGFLDEEEEKAVVVEKKGLKKVKEVTKGQEEKKVKEVKKVKKFNPPVIKEIEEESDGFIDDSEGENQGTPVLEVKEVEKEESDSEGFADDDDVDSNLIQASLRPQSISRSVPVQSVLDKMEVDQDDGEEGFVDVDDAKEEEEEGFVDEEEEEEGFVDEGEEFSAKVVVVPRPQTIQIKSENQSPTLELPLIISEESEDGFADEMEGIEEANKVTKGKDSDSSDGFIDEGEEVVGPVKIESTKSPLKLVKSGESKLKPAATAPTTGGLKRPLPPPKPKSMIQPPPKPKSMIQPPPLPSKARTTSLQPPPPPPPRRPSSVLQVDVQKKDKKEEKEEEGSDESGFADESSEEEGFVDDEDEPVVKKSSGKVSTAASGSVQPPPSKKMKLANGSVANGTASTSKIISKSSAPLSQLSKLQSIKIPKKSSIISNPSSAPVSTSKVVGPSLSPPRKSHSQSITKPTIPRRSFPPPPPPPSRPSNGNPTRRQSLPSPPSRARSNSQLNSNPAPPPPPPRSAAPSRPAAVVAPRSPNSITPTGPSTSKDPRKKVPHDPFNNGFVNRQTRGGYVLIDDLVSLHQTFITSTMGRKLNLDFQEFTITESNGTIDAGFSTIYRLKTYWGVARTFFDFDQVMKSNTPGAREVWIHAPVKGSIKEKIRIQDDYQALQLLLASLNYNVGIKENMIRQAETLRPNVTAIFIHASEIDKIGDVEGPLKNLENFRMEKKDGRVEEKDIIFVIFGGEDKERMFLEFWNPVAALAVSIKAFKEDPSRIKAQLEQSRRSTRNKLYHRDVFAWSPLNYVTRFGEFWVPVENERSEVMSASSESKEYQAAFYFIEGIIQNPPLINLVHPIRGTFESLITKDFPASTDREHYTREAIQELEEYLALSGSEIRNQRNDIEFLQDQSKRFKSKYLHVRRWIILGTEEEVEAAEFVPGIEVLNVEEVETFLLRDNWGH